MKPKEKANDLVFKFLRYSTEDCTDLYTGNPSTYKFKNAKQCALIAVDEIIGTEMLIDEDTYVEKKSYLAYWQEVKTEIEKL
jgi:hypothetical protein